MIKPAKIDHVVITAIDIDRTIEFYTQLFGCKVISFGDNRKAIKVGQQKFNLHQAGAEFTPHAFRPVAGSLDICILCETSIDSIVSSLGAQGIEVEAGPVQRTGANGPILSVYIRDPDGNLIELSNPVNV